MTKVVAQVVEVRTITTPEGNRISVLIGDGKSGGGGYFAPLWVVDGGVGSPAVGQNTFQNIRLIGASELNFIIVNKVVEVVGEDYLFDSGTGTITRNNDFMVGDTMITPYKK